MNGFEQIKGFYSWVFNNPDKIRPTHISLYLFLWNQANRANWVDWFKCPYDLAMQGACIGNKGTYYRCLDDLKLFELIDYKKGINNFKSPLVHLIQLYDNEHLTEQVTVPLSEPQYVPLYVPQCEPQYVPIYKLITDNLKLITENEKEFFNCILNLGKQELKFNFKKSLMDLGIDESVVSDWLKVRSKKKASNTETAFKTIKSEIEKSILSPTESIKKAVEKSWAGFEAEWIKNLNNTGNGQRERTDNASTGNNGFNGTKDPRIKVH